MDHKALLELARRVDAEAGSETFLYVLRDQLIQHGQINDVISVCRRIIMRVPPENRKAKSLAWSDLAYFLYQANRTDDSLAAALTAMQLDKDNDVAWEYMALSYWRKNEFHDAAAAYDQALRACPADQWTRRSFLSYSYSVLLREHGRDGDSMRYKLKAESLNERAEREGASSNTIFDGRPTPSRTP